MLRKTKSVKDNNSLPAGEEKAIIGEQNHFEGIIRSNEDLVINGAVTGVIELGKNHLTIAPKGRVEAEIYAQDVTVRGRLTGTLTAHSSVEIIGEADVKGSIKAKRVSIEDGVSLKATIELEHVPEEQTPTQEPISEQETYESETEPLTMPHRAESPTKKYKEDSSLETEKVAHNDNVIRLFIKGLKRQQDSEILDMGPVCSDNINFLARRVKRISVCDMFLQRHQQMHENLPIRKFWQQLDYPPHRFDGILLWDLIDYLKDREMSRLMELCNNMLRSRGLLMVFSMGEQETRTGIQSFVIGDGYRLTTRPQLHLDLPFHLRHSRKIFDLLAPFMLIKSFIHHNGLRQFLLRRD